MAVDYYLVSASRRAYRLKIERPYVFGREEGVDIVLQDALASRRHAEMRWQPQHACWVLTDLNSRNGVLANNQRISEPTRIDDGCQIQIGGQVYRMHLLPPGGDPGSLGNQAPQISTLETMGPGFSMADLSSQGATFTGEVTGGLLDLLQFFQTTAKSGRLDLVGPSAGISVNSVWMDKGTPIHASTGTVVGFEALVAMAIAPPPRFAFHAEGTPPTARTLKGSAAGILMEVARMVDEDKK
jgi:hypothetical protein